MKVNISFAKSFCLNSSRLLGFTSSDLKLVFFKILWLVNNFFKHGTSSPKNMKTLNRSQQVQVESQDCINITYQGISQDGKNYALWMNWEIKCNLESGCTARLQKIFQNLSDIISGRNKIPWDIYKNLSDINLYKTF